MSYASTPQEEEAMKNAANAAYKQFGIEDNVKKLVEDLVPRNVRTFAGYIAPVVDVVIRQKVEYTWNF